jgi:hypothetical protein
LRHLGFRRFLLVQIKRGNIARGEPATVGSETTQTTPPRVTLRPHDPATGEEIEKHQVVKGYEYTRGEFVTFTAEELKALDVESSKVIDLEKFVPRDDLDPVYFDSSYYLFPDGPIAVEALRVIGAAMAEARVVGLGRLTLSRRERMVMVEPRGTPASETATISHGEPPASGCFRILDEVAPTDRECFGEPLYSATLPP